MVFIELAWGGSVIIHYICRVWVDQSLYIIFVEFGWVSHYTCRVWVDQSLYIIYVEFVPLHIMFVSVSKI